MFELIAAVYGLALLAAGAVTALKGKWGMLVVGLVFGPAWIVGALRLARPGSFWARRFYDDEKQRRSAEVAARRRRGAIAVAIPALIFVAALLALFKAYRIPGAAMEPTLRCASPAPGCSATVSDRVLALRFVFGDPARGDVIFFETPREALAKCGSGGIFVKRVAAAPGDTWNGRRVPDGRYVVLGDNRPQSCDSRVWGTLPRENVIAKAVARYWPPDRVGRVR